jgi:hypothetical protein
MTSFINGLIRPYRGTIAIIVLAMLVETAAGLAGPWPLKVILDNVIGHHPLPVWIAPHVGTAAHAGEPRDPRIARADRYRRSRRARFVYR